MSSDMQVLRSELAHAFQLRDKLAAEVEQLRERAAAPLALHCPHCPDIAAPLYADSPADAPRIIGDHLTAQHHWVRPWDARQPQ